MTAIPKTGAQARASRIFKICVQDNLARNPYSTVINTFNLQICRTFLMSSNFAEHAMTIHTRPTSPLTLQGTYGGVRMKERRSLCGWGGGGDELILVAVRHSSVPGGLCLTTHRLLLVTFIIKHNLSRCFITFHTLKQTPAKVK